MLLKTHEVPHVRPGHLVLQGLYYSVDGNYRFVRDLREEVAEGATDASDREDLPLPASH